MIRFSLVVWLFAVPAFGRDRCVDLINHAEDLILAHRVKYGIEAAAAFAKGRNDLLLEMLEAGQPFEPAKGWRRGMTLAEATALRKWTEEDEVVGLESLPLYDPYGEYGYCYGRAAFVHLSAWWFHRVDARNIRKLWLVGKQTQGPSGWLYHVTTMVRDEETGRWLVIDPRMPAPMSPREWFNYWNQFSPTKTAVLYETDPKQFFPNIPVYTRASLFHEMWNGYFVDMLARFRLRFR